MNMKYLAVCFCATFLLLTSCKEDNQQLAGENKKAAQKKEVIYKNIKEGSNIVTDSYNGYDCLHWNYKHESVKHSVGEYVKENSRVAFKIHTNTVEGFWSIVKRTVNGTHHWISKKHTQAYLAEMEVRYNTKEQDDNIRFERFVSKVSGLRLKYQDLIL